MKKSYPPPGTFAGILPPYTDFDTARVVILPLPYDSTVEWRSGARDGPRAIINASQYLELYDMELDREVYRVGIHTLPELQPLMAGPKQMVQRVYRSARDIVKQEKILVMLGGEHSPTVGIVKAFTESFPNLTVLQLDAHADLRDEYLGTKYSHACVMRRVLEMCPIVQAGIRSLSREEQQFLNGRGMSPFSIENLASVEPIVAALSPDVYITIDLDVLDPSIMSAVGTPEPGGMSWQEILNLLREVACRRHIVGFDLVELCPNEGPVSCAFLAAKLAYKLIGYITTAEEAPENG